VTPAAQTPPAVNVLVAGTVAISGTAEWLELLTPSGTVVARTEINPTLSWMIGAGAGGAYWAQSGSERELTPSGAIRTLGSVPSDATGVVIGPDGNRIVVVHAGSASVIADRTSDVHHPTADAPSSWNYYLIGWNTAGIAFARVPSGGCGCGSFDMQMQSAYSAMINPWTATVTPLSASTSCPLSTVGTGLETVCFASVSTSLSTTAIRIGSGETVTHSYTLSGRTVAGDAVFSPDGRSLAYVTIPVAQDSCGVTVTATLHVLNLASGTAVARALTSNFTPSTWAPNGVLYGSISNGSSWSMASVNPTTLAVTRLTPAGQNALLAGIM
jgi:hypothetical protein